MAPNIQRTDYCEDSLREVQYSLNYQKKFEKEGHTLTFDYQYSKGIDE